MQTVADLIRRSQSIAVVSHIRPDGDAVGSVIALSRALTGLGKYCVGVLADGVPPVFSFLTTPGEITTQIPPNIELCIVVDAPDRQRTGFEEILEQIQREKHLAVIDHHPKGNLLSGNAANLHEVTASSTSELIYSLLSELGCRLTPGISTALLTGIFTDTGGFQYSNTSNKTMDVAAELMRRGGRLNLIVQEVSHSKTMASLKLLGIALARLRITWNGRCAVSVLTHEEIVAAGALQSDLLGIIGSLNELPDVRFSLLLMEYESGLVRGTLRSGDRQPFNVGQLATALGGGGHPRAAGFMLPGSLEVNELTWKVIAPSGKTS